METNLWCHCRQYFQFQFSCLQFLLKFCFIVFNFCKRKRFKFKLKAVTGNFLCAYFLQFLNLKDSILPFKTLKNKLIFINHHVFFSKRCSVPRIFIIYIFESPLIINQFSFIYIIRCFPYTTCIFNDIGNNYLVHA